MHEIFRYVYLAILGLLCVYSVLKITQNSFYIKLYAIITFIVESFGLYHLFNHSVSLSWLYNFYAIVEIIIWSIFFLKLILGKIPSYTILIFFFYLFFYFYLNDFSLSKNNSSGFLLNNFIITTYIAFYLLKIIKNNQAITGDFWISIGALFYNLGSFVLTGLVFLLFTMDPELASFLFSINTILNIIFYSLVFVGIYINDKKYNWSTY